MSTQMADPHLGMVSFQQALRKGILELRKVSNYPNLYAHLDVPEPGVKRLTYVRLDEDLRTVQAFVACILNGTVEGQPCVSLGYAVPKEYRNRGFAKQIVKDVVEDTIFQVGRAGNKAVYVEAIIDVENVASQLVAEAVLQVERESITDGESGRPAYRYTKRYETAARRKA